MKQFYFIRSMDPGGAERQMVALTNGMAERGHTVSLGIFYGGGELEKDLDPRVKLIDLHKEGRWDTFGFLRRFIRAVRQAEPDILYSFLGTANLLSVLAKPFLPSVPIVWGVRASNMDLAHYGRLHQWHFKAECLLSRFADAIIANSHAGADHVRDYGFSANKMLVIPNGIDTEKYTPRNRDRDGGTFTIGIAARVDPMKDHATFLQAAAIAAKKQPDLRFACIGRGSEGLADSVTASDMTDKIKLRGEIRDMTEAFGTLDLACLSSAFGEGFPNVLGEAMACGVPCVATDVGDAAHVIGETGAIVPPRDPAALADAMLAMRARIQETPELGSVCRKRIQDQFSLDSLLERTEATLHSLVTANNRH